MGDPPQAIEKIADDIMQGKRAQTLMGVTGFGKTFTMAKIIEKIRKSTLVIRLWGRSCTVNLKSFSLKMRWNILCYSLLMW